MLWSVFGIITFVRLTVVIVWRDGFIQKQPLIEKPWSISLSAAEYFCGDLRAHFSNLFHHLARPHCFSPYHIWQACFFAPLLLVNNNMTCIRGAAGTVQDVSPLLFISWAVSSTDKRQWFAQRLTVCLFPFSSEGPSSANFNMAASEAQVFGEMSFLIKSQVL